MATQDGTQAIRRAAEIMKRIARVSEGHPATLRHISEAVDLPRSTVHRILKCLTDTGLAAYDPATRRYEIGLLNYELGLAVTDNVLEMAPWCAVADRIAQRANVTTYLMRRSGFDAVCVHKADARSVIRVIPVEVGQRRYLGVGAGAAALLAGLDDDSVERILATIEPELERYEALTVEGMRKAVADTRRTGFSESRSRVYKSIYGLGVALRTPSGAPVFAISIAAHAPDVSEVRIQSWKTIMMEEISAVNSR